MNKQKSWGNSTKSTTINASGSPIRREIPMYMQCQDIQNKQILFLHAKNRELQEGTLRMAHYIYQLQEKKEQLLKLNHRYIQTLNHQFKDRHHAFQKQIKKQTSNSHPFCKNCNKDILIQFEKDYRNLVKHCKVLETEIFSKNQDLQKYQHMKKEILESKHDSIEQIEDLVRQLMETTQKLVQTKKQNNKIGFQLQKCKEESQRLKRSSLQSKNGVGQLEAQLESYKSVINTMQNEFIDKENGFMQKIYQMDVTIERLQKDIRAAQLEATKCKRKQEELRVEQIEVINTREQRRSYSQAKGLKFINITKDQRIYR